MPGPTLLTMFLVNKLGITVLKKGCILKCQLVSRCWRKVVEKLTEDPGCERGCHTNAKLYVCMLGSPESLPEGAGVQWVQAGTHQRDNPRNGLKERSPNNQRMELPLARTDEKCNPVVGATMELSAVPAVSKQASTPAAPAVTVGLGCCCSCSVVVACCRREWRS